MSNSEHVIYIEGVGGLPKIQENLAEIWKPFNLSVEHQPIGWENSDYRHRLQNIGKHIVELSEQARVSIVGASGGGKPALSLFASYPKYIHRVVTISSKISPYILGDGSRKAYPNLVKSSDNFPNSLEIINYEMRQRVLCIHPLSDEIVAPEDAILEHANQFTIQTNGHIDGITRALTNDAQIIANFIHQD